MAWMNNDELLLQYGTEKAVPTTGGDYRSPGTTRVVEVQVDLTTLTSTPQIADNAKTTFFGAGMFIEEVEMVVDVLPVGGTNFSVGLLGYDGTTAISNSGFIGSMTPAIATPVGKKIVLVKGSAGAGSYVGGLSGGPGYISAVASGTFTEGKVTVRIKYRGVPPITR